MSDFRHGIRFDNSIDAALYALAMAKQYERNSAFWEKFARDRGELACEVARESRQHSRRMEDKGERILLRLRGLYHYNLADFGPHIEKLADAFQEATSFVTVRAMQLQPANLTLFQKGLRLIATAPDLNGSKR